MTDVSTTAESIAGDALMFRYSGLIDALRDATAQLLGHEPDQRAAADAVDQYNKLREHLLNVVDEDGFTEICTWTTHLDAGTTMQATYLACVALARVVDVVHQTPEFLLSQQVREVNADEVRAQIENARPRKSVDPSVLHFGIGFTN
jgi:hypothetical protein